MSIEDTKCRTCGRSAFMHSSLHAGIRRAVRKDGKWTDKVICTQYNPPLKAKKILFTGPWSQWTEISKRMSK